MFWKKKPKDEAPKNDKKGAAREEPRREEPRSAPASAPSRASPPPSAAPGGDLRARILAALVAPGASQPAPESPESERARAAAVDSLLADANVRGVVQMLGERRAAEAFAALERDAQAGGPEKWRRLGALLFGLDAQRARAAYEKAFAAAQNDYLGALMLARLRGITGDADGANIAASTAVMAARTPDERGVAHTDVALIALARRDWSTAINHARLAVDAQRGAIQAGARDANAVRDLVMRLTLLGDASLSSGAPAEARAHYEEALIGARKLAAVDPSHVGLARGLAELLEKSAATASSGGEHPDGVARCEEAITIRRRLIESGDRSSERGLASALNTMGEIKRLGGNRDGARYAFEESVKITQALIARDPADVGARRQLWSVLWRFAIMEGTPQRWRQAAEAMEALGGHVELGPKDLQQLEEARRRAAA
jgi:tetratricopeptide (TPR) repeat protein